MKKIISFILASLMAVFICAEEKKLFDSSAKANIEGMQEFDYISNFEIVSDSGAFNKNDLIILEPNENGIRFAAVNPPRYNSCTYKVIPAYDSYLNEGIDGAGTIKNAGLIKAVKIVCSTNRPYDEVFLMYSTSPKGEIKYIKMPQEFSAVKSMEENTFIFENPNYQKNVNKRDIINRPLVGSEADGIYLKGFKIQTNAASGYNVYSPYSIFYLKEVSIIYDKAEDDEKIELNKDIESEFGFKNTKDADKQRAIQKIQERERIRAGMKMLMATETVKTDSTSSEDVK